MGTRAQIDVCKGNKVVRLYSQFDAWPSNVLPVLRDAARAGHSTPSSIARAIIKQWDGMKILDEDYGDDGLNYRYRVDVSSKPWRVRQTEMAGVQLPTKPDGSLDDSNEALENPANFRPAVTRYLSIGA